MPVPAYRASVSVRDSEGHESTMTLYRDGDLAHQDAIDAANGLVALIEAISDGEVSRVEITQVLSTDATVPAGNVDNEIKALFTFYNEDGLTTQISVPAFNRALLLANSDEVDVENASVAAFIAEMEDGGWTDLRAADLTALKSAVEHYGNRRKS